MNDKPTPEQFRPLYDAVKTAIYNHSSPTVGRGDVHGGQNGFIVYEPALQFIASNIWTALCAQPRRLGPPTTLALCPVGLFLYDDRLCFKPETVTRNPVCGFDQTDAYWIDTGEYFWGGAPAPEFRETKIVRPVALEAFMMDMASS